MRCQTAGLIPALLLLSISAVAGPRYVEAPPLAQTLAKAKVADMAAGPVTVPMITWGGDIATIVANGNAARTAAGSPFAAEGLSLTLVREDVFTRQIESYLSGRSPYLRGTVGMLNQAIDVLSRDPRTVPVLIYQMTWSAGGDHLVVGPGIGSARDLRGKTIALQAYGPHVDYLAKVLADAGLKPTDVTIKWLPDLTGTDDTPMAALQAGDAQAAFVITPDALLLTSGGTVGSGAEGSVKGARLLLSTKTANRIIADVYAVRSDYFKANRKAVESFTHGLMLGEERLRAIVRERASRQGEYAATFAAAAKLLLDSEHAVADAEGLYADAEFTGYAANVDFFSNPDYPRSLSRLTAEAQASLSAMGLVKGGATLGAANWDYPRMAQGLSNTYAVEAPRFQSARVAEVVTRKQQQGTLGSGELFSFEIFFGPNQNTFSADLYADAFERVTNLASTYGGALVTVEGHSDPLQFLRGQKAGESEVVLGQIKQSAKNLSMSRANAVREAVMTFARSRSIALDPSQFAVVGHGIAKPKSGICGSNPCAPKDEQEWRANMRVEFRLISVEAESDVFQPLN